MTQELAEYQFKLDQVDEALAKDPDNQELGKLRADLKELIALFAGIAEEAPATSNKESKKKRGGGGGNAQPAAGAVRWEVGTQVSAKYKGDGNFYEAVVHGVPDADDDTYTVVFAGYHKPEPVKGSDIRYSAQPPTSIEDAARAAKPKKVEGPAAPVTEATIAATNPDAIKKKKKPFKPRDPTQPTKKEQEQSSKQQAWLQFAKGGSSSGSGAEKKRNIFATPDDPMAKVGVVGSGKPMTQFQQRGKHVFQAD
ncbi:uncharacterized protein EV422DRAFT_491434 [Fimicolochytrium jonesii]|uniref:uncharacterized protein n=1 Tax=Fimicolochytrium jonesii TaxID=1396493 RepID=UPI0022FE2E69|nr:uncharacterized protein EV422DRAFT_491434 [Fimicolochytrium jonesii]KAI8825819.1 hypothetical protein EV422DRAFT_491434 [Fimicolochytrium jonesii]